MLGPETVPPDIPRTEEQVGTPAWMRLTHEEEVQAGDISLHQHGLVIEADKILVEETRERMQAFQEPKLKVWSQEQITDWQAVMTDENTYVAFVATGLASDHTELNRPDSSFLGSLYQQFDARCADRPGGKPNLVVVAVSCPGFGESGLKKEANNGAVEPEDVSRQVYAELLHDVVRLADIPEERTVSVGHSAGGSGLVAYLERYTTEMKPVLLSPSLNLGNLEYFKTLRTLDTATKVLARLRKYPLELVVRILMGLPAVGKLSPGKAAQVQMHMDQMEQHPQANAAKLLELAQPYTLEDLQMSGLPRAVICESDRTTPAEATTKWYQAFNQVVLERLEANGLSLSNLGEAETQFRRDLADFVTTTIGGAHHDDYFIESGAAQKAAINLILDQFERQMLTRWPRYADLAEMIRYLHEREFPMELRYEPDSTGLRDEHYYKL